MLAEPSEAGTKHSSDSAALHDSWGKPKAPEADQKEMHNEGGCTGPST